MTLPPLNKTLNNIENISPNRTVNTNSKYDSKSLSKSFIDMNPFRLPSDEEIFLAREAEKKRTLENKSRMKDFRIWEKRTATTKASLRRVKVEEIVHPIFDMDRDQIYPRNKKDRKNKSEALQQIKNRLPPNYELKEPSRNEYVSQKKELFLVQMALTTIKKETDNLKEKAKKKESAYDESSRMLEYHKTKLTELFETDSKNVKKKEEELSNLIKEKLKLEDNLKKVMQEESSLYSEKVKNEEGVKKFEEYKNFLDKLSMPQWLQNQAEELESRIENERARYIQEKIKKGEDNESNDHSSEISRETSSKQTKAFKRSIAMKEESLTTKKLFTQEFNDLMEKGKISGLNPYESKLYFSNPEDLISCFLEKEDNNLFLVQQIQSLEKEIEDKKLIMEQSNKKLDHSYNILLKSKTEILSQIEDEKSRLNRQENSDSFVSQDYERQVLEKLRKKLEETYQKNG